MVLQNVYIDCDKNKEKVKEVKVPVKGPPNEKDGVFTILRGVKLKVDSDKINRPLNGTVGEAKKTSEKEPHGKQSSQKKVKKPAIASGVDRCCLFEYPHISQPESLIKSVCFSFENQ